LTDALAQDGPAGVERARALLGEIGDEQARLEERREMLSSASFEGLFIHIDGVVIDVNQRLCELLGYSYDEMLGSATLRRCVAPEDLPGVLKRMNERYEGEYVITAVRKDGSRFPAELQSKQGHIGDRPIRVVAVRDVTARERMNALLRESERRFRDLAVAAFDLIVYSRDGVIVDIGGDVGPIFGIAREAMIGQPILAFTAAVSQPLVRQIINEGRVGAYEAAAVDPRGEVVPLQCVVAATTLNGLPVRAAGVRDLRPARRLEAERRALEQQVERAQRLDSLGVLAGGIAHDFNNLLAGVLGNADLLVHSLTDPNDREAAQAIVTAARRAAALTRQMLAYAGQRDLGGREPVDLGGLVRELRTLLDATLSKKAELELAIAPGSVVLGDRATLGQVLMNLLTNASDALCERPGRISVHCKPVREVDARWDAAQGATVGPGAWILVEVRDSGVGMDAATRGRVFEPFFSTKEKGHGLGLAACLGIVSTHGGAVLVESEPGRGSCFSVLLPASDAVDRAGDGAHSRPAPQPCRVLVVDDEALVRSQLRRSLELRGYAVEEVTDGNAAIARLAAAGAGHLPDVVILDMTMPDMDGAEVLRRVRASGSRVPIVVSSGYLDVAVERRLPRGAFQGFLPKPYGSTDLVDAIARALAAPVDEPETS
jgi:two-component system cell cycle sensor histidine kinase/response regulator CckA